MHPTADFLALMQRGTREDIIREIRCNPGIVMDTWQRKHGHEWDGERWAPSGRDVGWDAMPWLWAFRVAGFTSNLQPTKPPQGPIRLYRGASHARRIGMGWSSSYDYAAKYAAEDGAGTKYTGNLYLHWAWPDELLAYVYNDTADEYVLDTRHLNDHNVAMLPLSPIAYSGLYTRCITRAAYRRVGL